MRNPRDVFLRVDTDDEGEPESFEFVDEIPPDAGCLICMRLSVPLIMPDNAVGRCAACDCPIQFRPIAPPAIAKVCVECAPAWIEGQTNVQ